MSISPSDGLARARQLDRDDPLRTFRDRFVSDDPELVYLDGNSLGRLPCATVERMRAVTEQEWGGRLIRGWNDGWYQLSERLGAKLARLLGAAPDEVILADSTSVNLFKLAVAALRARPERRTIVSDTGNFPSDLYILQSAAEASHGGYDLRLVPSRDGLTVDPADLRDALGSDVALLSLSHTAFKSAFVYDLAAITAMAHESGALALWDLSHSVGAMPLDLRGAGVDLAVGCCYKYLNGGPGAPAFLYVRRELQETLHNPVAGWFGQRDPFNFALEYAPEVGLRRFLSGTPPILALSAVEPGLDLLLEVGLDAVREKSVRATSFLIDLWETELRDLGVDVRSPRRPQIRGSHVSLGHPEARRISRALVEQYNVIPDFRTPDNLRLGISPLYTSYEEIHRGVAALRDCIVQGTYRDYPSETTGTVT